MSTRRKNTLRAVVGSGPGGPRISRLAAAVGLALYGANATAAVFTVTNTNDDANPGSLRAAVALANTTPGPDEIRFDPLIFGQTIAVSADRLFVAEDLTITGPGRDQLTIELTAADDPLINMDSGSGTTLTISDLRLLRSSDLARGIIVHDGSSGAINVLRCDLINTVSGPAPAFMEGAIAGSNVSIAVVDSQIDGFPAQPGSGGAITFTSNDDDGLAIVDTVFRNNSAPDGGAIYYEDNGDAIVLIENSIFDNNTATAGNGGALYLHGREGSQLDMEITGSSFTNNQAETGGGAIFLQANDPVTRTGLAVSGTLFEGNEATGANARGGAISVGEGGAATNTVSLQISDSTLSGNSATGQGGAIATFSEGSEIDLDILHATLFDNDSGAQGGGIQVDGTTTLVRVRLTNSIVAGNTAAVDGPDVFGNVETYYSLLGNSAAAVLAASEATLLDIDPMLGPLADNGGFLRTHALPEGSPAIDVGTTLADTFSDAQGTGFDQRGDGFPRFNGVAPDLGAYEWLGDSVDDDDDDDDDNGLGLGGWLLGLLAGLVALRRVHGSE